LREARLRGTTIARVGTTPGLGLYGQSGMLPNAWTCERAESITRRRKFFMVRPGSLPRSTSWVRMCPWWHGGHRGGRCRGRGRSAEAVRAQRRGGAGAEGRSA
jgi:hypothetical protein